MQTSNRPPTLLVRRETLRERRRLHNEARVAAAGGGSALPTTEVDVRCECREVECRTTFLVPVGVYDDVRRRGETYFLVTPKHALPDRVALYADKFFVAVDRNLEGAAIRERARLQRVRAMRARADSAEQGERTAAARERLAALAEQLGRRVEYWRRLRESRPGQLPG